MAGPGVVIQIRGDGEGARQALEMVQQKMRETASAADRYGSTMDRAGGSTGHAIPPMAAASAALRALEGGFSNNIRAGERFLSMLPGVATALEGAFPYIGALVLVTALVKVGEEAYHAFENISLLKGATESLNSLDITVAKKLKSNADEAEAAMERMTESLHGKQAANKQKLAYESAQGLDLSEYFYNDKFKTLPDNVKANYETLYKNIAPQDLPDRLARIRREITDLNGALAYSKDDNSGGFTQRVGGYGPGLVQDSEKYYTARLKAATQLKQQLESEASLRGIKLQELRLDANTPDKTDKDKAAKTDDPIARATAQLAEEQAKAAADAVKTRGQAELAELDAQHKMMLVSDQEYYREKFDLQNQSFDAEQSALTQRRATLEALLKRQQGDRTLKRDGSGHSSEELTTQKELVQLQEKQDELMGRRLATESAYNAENDASNRAAEIASLRVAAELEKERGTGIAAQIALLQRESALEQQRTRNQGGSDGDVAAVKATSDLAVQRLQLNQIGQEIARTEADYQRKIEDTNDAVSKGDMGQLAGRRQVQALQQQEAAAVDDLIQRYRGLADATGNPEEIEKAKQYQQQLAQLGRVDQSQAFGTQVRTGLEDITTSLANMAATGKQSFKGMVDSMVQDVARLAMEIATKKFLTPLFEGFGGTAAAAAGGGGGGGSFLGGDLDISGLTSALFEQHASGGLGSGGPQVVGEKGIELWTPPSSGGSYTTTDMLKSMAEKGGGGGTPQVTQNITNRSNTPLTSSTPKVSYNRQLRQFVIDTILDEHDRGGPVRDLFGH